MIKRYYRKRLKQALTAVGVSVVGFLFSMLFAMTIVAMTGCERRDLFVSGAEFHSLTLNVDWHEYAERNPDGMTAWFWPRETDDILVPDSLAEWGSPYRFTTSSVQKFDLYLHGGRYRGVMIDYSPEEYSRQSFVGFDDALTACVVALPDPDQPRMDSLGYNQSLYDSNAFGRELSGKQNGSNLCVLSCQPEEMSVAIFPRMEIVAGDYGDYVPYGERDTYQQQLTVKEFQAYPRSIIKKLHVRLPIKGISNIWQVEATVAGMANGHYLFRDCNTDTPCLIRVTDWQVVKTSDEGLGYIESTIRTFGPCSSFGNSSKARAFTRSGQETDEADEIRLNICFTLRDRKTTCTYHYDLGNYLQESSDGREFGLLLTNDDFANDPSLGSQSVDLPYVEVYDGAGFGADVTPWDSGTEVEIPM